MTRTLLAIGWMGCCFAVACADEPNPRATEEAAIRSAVEAYVTTFNQADAEALAALWSPEAVYSNPISGDQVMGREAIKNQFAGIFAETSGIKLTATTNSIDFISPNVAVENGSAKLVQADSLLEASEYTAVYVKRDGMWLLDRVTEEPVIEVPSNYEQLKELEWMVGHWTDQDDTSTVTTDCHWTRNNNFLVRSFTVQIRDRIDMAGMQLIGWDPAAKQIRSWVFDSDGGFGMGTWTNKGNRWSVQKRGILPDGRRSSAVNIFTQRDENTMTLQSVNRMVDGELLPNIDEVEITKE
ncbi:SgcJ/EcaC family oxidoreductase [Novipirellula artificiosorum]|uniref:SnoaL-like domain protein n=1 Tax=Novipirellula artificiosorum TaxID=2528016 RepID=A0A5C6D106_9BACT|nr:SgcJ/EcaC family oxidoreductase [Novipirellula artificiosorum]TWU30833.1 SnoaL-like domain protein [Novipirellula artificiosorum]